MSRPTPQLLWMVVGLTHAGARAHEAHHLVTLLPQRAHGGLTDGAGGTDDEDTPHAVCPSCRKG